jgi:hypothetical protein
MDRRQFLKTSIVSLSAPSLIETEMLAATEAVERRLLSSHGSTRATGYAEANKIVTIGDKTHVSWMDSIKEGFRVRICTFDHKTGGWSKVWTIGEAYDNHGGPALAADHDGHLHVAYYPHHHPMRYRRSVRPNDASAWTDAEEIGRKTTYPTLVCDVNNTLYLTCRERHGDTWHVDLYKKTVGAKVWVGPHTILKSRNKGYAHFQEAIALDPDGQTLHLSCRIFEKAPHQQTVGYMVSRDGGQSWQKHTGDQLQLPVTADRIDTLAVGGRERDRPTVRAGSIEVDSNGQPLVLYSEILHGKADVFLSWPHGDKWQRMGLRQALPTAQKDWKVFSPAVVTKTESGEYVVAATMIAPRVKHHLYWGKDGCEVVQFDIPNPRSPKGITSRLLSQLDTQTPHWLPNMERRVAHNRVPNNPSVIYTAGIPGDKNRDIHANEVYWCR